MNVVSCREVWEVKQLLSSHSAIMRLEIKDLPTFSGKVYVWDFINTLVQLFVFPQLWGSWTHAQSLPNEFLSLHYHNTSKAVPVCWVFFLYYLYHKLQLFIPVSLAILNIIYFHKVSLFNYATPSYFWLKDFHCLLCRHK